MFDSLTKISSRYSSTSKNLSRLSLTANRLVDVVGSETSSFVVAWSSTVIIDTFVSFSISDLSMDIGDKISLMHTGVSMSCLISCNGNLQKKIASHESNSMNFIDSSTYIQDYFSDQSLHVIWGKKLIVEIDKCWFHCENNTFLCVSIGGTIISGDMFSYFNQVGSRYWEFFRWIIVHHENRSHIFNCIVPEVICSCGKKIFSKKIIMTQLKLPKKGLKICN